MSTLGNSESAASSAQHNPQKVVALSPPRVCTVPARMVGLGFLFLIACLPLQAATPSRSDARQQLAASNVDPSIDRLIQYAAEGDIATVELLLAAGVPVNAADPVRKVTPLHNAAAQGHARLVTRFLELGAHIDAQDWTGCTPLINAAYLGRTTVVEILLTHKAATNIRPAHGPTALISAVQSGSVSIVEKLLAAGADPRLSDNEGQTPLAAAELSHRTAMVDVLQAAVTGSAP